MQNPITFALFMFFLSGTLTSAHAKGVTPQEINSKSCGEYVNSVFEALPNFSESKYLNKKNATRACIGEMNNNYKIGLPSYATHTPKDIENYREEKRKKTVIESRAKNKDELNQIAKLCVKPIFNIYVGMNSLKKEGVSKVDQVKVLRTKIHTTESNSILEEILIYLSFKALDDIYSKTAPISDSEVAERVLVFYEKCTEMYEQALFLR